MIKSMTGYGAAQTDAVKIELKSVNNRYFDFNVKLPRAFMSLEEPLKQLAQKRISRGKVDVFITAAIQAQYAAHLPNALPKQRGLRVIMHFSILFF